MTEPNTIADPTPAAVPGGPPPAPHPDGPPIGPPAPATIARWLTHFNDPADAVECRVVHTDGRTTSGEFDGVELLTLAEEALAVPDAKGVYFTPNPLDRRRAWSVQRLREGPAAKDKHIKCRRWVFIDVDSTRPPDMSATDAEKAAAWAVTVRVRDYLTAAAWPAPILCDSGNGYHLFYRLADEQPVPDELPANDPLKSFLRHLAARFDTGGAAVDTTVCNPSRVAKLPGTLGRKGENTADRPHRWSRLLSAPEPGAARATWVQVCEVADRPNPAPDPAPTARAGKRKARAARHAPDAPAGGPIDVGDLTDRVPKYLAKMPPSIQGQNGNAVACRVSMALVKGFALTPDEALPFFNDWNTSGAAVPPWSEGELRRMLDTAAAAPDLNPRGWLLRRSVADGSSPAPGSGAAESPESPVRLARLFLDAHRDESGAATLRYWRGEFHEWDAGAYSPVSDDEVRGRLTEHCHAEFERLNVEEGVGDSIPGDADAPPTTFLVNKPLVANVRQALESLARLKLPDAAPVPAWLDDVPGPDPARLVAVRNGLLDLDALAAGRPCLLPPTPSFFTPSALPVDFDPVAPPPARWLAFLREVFPGDPASAALLQEWFGYCLTPDTSRHKMMFMIGSGRNGKGTVGRVLAALVGERNAAGLSSLDSLGERFGLMPLLGKSVAVVGECRVSGRADGVRLVAVLNSITGEDKQTVDRKGLAQVSVRLPTRFTLMANETPRFADASAAVVRRMLCLRFPVSFRGREDAGLEGKLLAELAGVLLWALAGLARLAAGGRFTEPPAAAAVADELEAASSPVRVFVRDCCRVARGESVRVEDLYRAFGTWCDANGQRRLSAQEFGGQLDASVPGLTKRRPNRDGDRRRMHDGLSLRPPGDDAGEPDQPDGTQPPGGPPADPFVWPPFPTVEADAGGVRSAPDHLDHVDPNSASDPGRSTRSMDPSNPGIGAVSSSDAVVAVVVESAGCIEGGLEGSMDRVDRPVLATEPADPPPTHPYVSKKLDLTELPDAPVRGADAVELGGVTYYRLTPGVLAWVEVMVGRLEAPDRDPPAPPDQLQEAARCYARILEHAYRLFPQDVLTAARRRAAEHGPTLPTSPIDLS